MNMLAIPVGPLQGNCYLVWDDERRACAVDPGGEADRLAQTVAKEDLDLIAILVTHGHFDHVEGVAGLAESTGAKVYCSPAVEPVLSAQAGCSATGLPIPGVKDGDIVVVKDGEELQVGALSVKVIATPGHTPGDITFEIDGRLFCGDLLFHGSVGRTDFPGGDFEQLLSSVSRLTEVYPPSTHVYPGHMDETTLGEESAHNPFLAGLHGRG
jgi:glyoxylase-like metal-dependent hydrolase (beta-lactamase superfamily II)